MQAISVGIVAMFLLVLGIAIAFAFTLGAPILAVPFFLAGFGAFLIWRGRKRAEGFSGGARRRVPTTEEAAADPAADSSLPDVARAKSHTASR
jgi:hypothetical protein